MKNAKVTLLKKCSICFVCVVLLFGSLRVILGDGSSLTAEATANERCHETVYCDDEVYGDISYDGQGEHISATYDIVCDEMEEVSQAGISDVPSFGNRDSSMQSVCGPVAGTNVVAYYDRWYDNLIPNYTTGMMSSSGNYRYLPDLGLDATNNVIRSLYALMNVATVGGTTSANFKSGMLKYVNNAGYSFSYSSFYQNETAVNLQQLTAAINQNKVGVVMCSRYNFVYGISQSNDGYVHIAKINSTVGHMMMVYGYQTFAFYQNGSLLTTKTFLNVCSGFGTSDIGYMELNDFLNIEEAIIITIT